MGTPWAFIATIATIAFFSTGIVVQGQVARVYGGWTGQIESSVGLSTPSINVIEHRARGCLILKG